jgi:hypothetical protein
MTNANRIIQANSLVSQHRVPNGLPYLVDKFISNEKQFLLSQLSYSRLLDIYSGVNCFPIHIATEQVDEVYVGMQRTGISHVFLVRVATGDRPLRTSDLRKCFDHFATEFSSAFVRLIVVQAVVMGVIAILEFHMGSTVELVGEKHYQILQQVDIDTENSGNRT